MKTNKEVDRVTGLVNYFSKKEKKCLNCNKKFINKHYNKKVFCSISCSWKYKKRDKKYWINYFKDYWNKIIEKEYDKK